MKVELSTKFIDWNYCKKKCRESIPDSEASEQDVGSQLSQSLEESKYADN